MGRATAKQQDKTSHHRDEPRILQKKAHRLSVSTRHGSLDIESDSGCLSRANVRLDTAQGRYSALKGASVDKTSAACGRWTRENDGLRVHTDIAVESGPWTWSLRVLIRNTTRRRIALQRVCLLDFPLSRFGLHNGDADVFGYVMHRLSSGPAGIRNLSRPQQRTALFGEYRPIPGHTPEWICGWESWLVTALFQPGRPGGFFAGFEVEQGLPSHISFSNGRIRVINDFAGHLRPGRTWTSEKLLFGFTRNLHACFEKYGRTLHARTRPRSSGPFAGWNSWDYYFSGVDQKDIEDNVAAARGDSHMRNKLKTMVIDDGWQVRHGDWEGNAKFCHDIGDVARRIRQAGFRPGIWLAPFLAHPESSFARRAPQALEPRPARAVSAVDPTHPQAHKEFRRIFRDLCRKGFEFFKLDFLHVWPEDQPFYLPEYTSEMAVAKGLSVIREAVGDDVGILACGNLAGAPAPIDADRTAGDTAPYWSNILNIGRGAAHKYWMNCRHFSTDMDFLLLRTPDTLAVGPFDERGIHAKRSATFYDRPYKPFGIRAGRMMNLNECYVLASVIVLTGGNLFFSEDLSRLNETGRTIVRRALKYRSPKAAVPLDLFDSPMPRLWLRKGRTRSLLGVFNWTDRTSRNTLRWQRLGLPRPSAVYDVWRDTALTPGASLRLSMPPRTCRLLDLKTTH